MRRGLDGTKNFLRYDKRRPCSVIFLAFSGGLELARIGIPAHNIPRVQEELARLTADKTLTREELGKLAEEISWLLL